MQPRDGHVHESDDCRRRVPFARRNGFGLGFEEALISFVLRAIHAPREAKKQAENCSELL